MTKFYVDSNGIYLGGFDGAEPQAGAIEVPSAPNDGRQIWNGNSWNVLEPTSDEVNAERDRRIARGFVFNTKSYAMDSESKARIIGAATLAGFAVGAGAQAGNYRWANASNDFVWIADDNSLTLMDAQTCFAFGQAAAAWESSCIFAARAIKETSPVPNAFTDDGYWPVSA